MRMLARSGGPSALRAWFARAACGAVGLVFCMPLSAAAQPADASAPAAGEARELFRRYCVACHNDRLETAGFSLEATLDHLDAAGIAASAETWERVAHKLRVATMPPSDQAQPPAEERTAALRWLTSTLDAASAAQPDPGRTETLRRLNRTEYRNAIRDLLALDIDAGLLPPDESSHGFDNVILGDLPPTLLDRYVSAARRISALAVGGTSASVDSVVFSVPADTTQEAHVPGLPIGTRGGIAISHTFPADGEYDIQVRLARNRNGNIGGLRDPRPHELEVLLDRWPVANFTVQRPEEFVDDAQVDANLKVRVLVTAGPHDVGATFVQNAASLLETERQPLQSHFNETRHPRLTPAVYQVTITGPYEAKGADDTPSRQRIFVCRPAAEEAEACAREILSTLARRAYRRPLVPGDLETPLAFFREGLTAAGFDAGIERGLGAVLMNPEFLLRVEVDPADAAPGEPYRVSDLELASRLSFFLWSSIPDDELLEAAERGVLSNPDELERQTRRMLADPRSYNLASNFAGQWLQLRNLAAVSPNGRIFPDFDDNLRQAFREETERFFDSVLRENRGVADLLRADYTFLNERLAKHYGIPGVYGTRFRRVELDANSRRGGLLRQGSILSVTSYATRTSPVIRGVWVLSNIFGAPPPPPLPNVPALEDAQVDPNLPLRERLAAHRANPVCANCHRTIDPVGFALENYDALGRWREHEGDNASIDVSGALPGVGEFEGIDGLVDSLLTHPDLFAGTITEKLMTFALGRGVEYFDQPALRRILREAEPDDFRLSSLIVGIVRSAPFQMRRAES